MFSRYDCCYHCSHHHRRLTFRRGMAAMLILVVLVFALLHAQKPGSHQHPARTHTAPTTPAVPGEDMSRRGHGRVTSGTTHRATTPVTCTPG